MFIPIYQLVASFFVTVSNSIERGEKHPYVKQVMKAMGNGLKSGQVVQESKTPSVPAPQIYEAEQAILVGSAKVNNEHSGFSGSGYVDGYGYRGLGSTTIVKAINNLTYFNFDRRGFLTPS